MCTAKDRNNFTTFFAFFFGGFVAKITSPGFLPYTKIAQSNFLIVWEGYNSDHNNKKGKGIKLEVCSVSQKLVTQAAHWPRKSMD